MTRKIATDCTAPGFYSHKEMGGTRLRNGEIATDSYPHVDDTAVCDGCHVEIVYLNTYGASISNDSVNYDAPRTLVPEGVNVLRSLADRLGIDADFVTESIGPGGDGYGRDVVVIGGHWSNSKIPVSFRVAATVRTYWVALTGRALSDDEIANRVPLVLDSDGDMVAID